MRRFLSILTAALLASATASALTIKSETGVPLTLVPSTLAQKTNENGTVIAGAVRVETVLPHRVMATIVVALDCDQGSGMLLHTRAEEETPFLVQTWHADGMAAGDEIARYVCGLKE